MEQFSYVRLPVIVPPPADDRVDRLDHVAEPDRSTVAAQVSDLILEPVHRFLPRYGVETQGVGSSCALVCGQPEPFALSDLVPEEFEPVRDVHDPGLLRMHTVAIAGHKPVMDRFCSASSYEDAVEIWAQYVTQHPHSKSVANLLKGPPWARGEIQTLANHMSTSLGFGVGYANYGQEVLNLIDECNLTRYD